MTPKPGLVIGMLFGALIIGVLMNGMNMLGIESFTQYIAKGLVILLAVLVESRGKRD